ncbi:unnamed protein product [Trifolium pratense]|uniref:Uncharacterized protein n=1 Tax=Trifolium pratense TaxID=57577 RepID=A0ACB0LXC3_TRIPR|nr:unnamed protein product [Trifolium pratense]
MDCEDSYFLVSLVLFFKIAILLQFRGVPEVSLLCFQVWSFLWKAGWFAFQVVYLKLLVAEFIFSYIAFKYADSFALLSSSVP